MRCYIYMPIPNTLSHDTRVSWHVSTKLCNDVTV